MLRYHNGGVVNNAVVLAVIRPDLKLESHMVVFVHLGGLFKLKELNNNKIILSIKIIMIRREVGHFWAYLYTNLREEREKKEKRKLLKKELGGLLRT